MPKQSVAAPKAIEAEYSLTGQCESDRYLSAGGTEFAEPPRALFLTISAVSTAGAVGELDNNDCK
jgi:hypothetical protein